MLREELVVVGVQKLRAQQLMAREQLLERRKGIAGNVKGGNLHVAEELEELIRVQHDLGQRLVPGALLSMVPEFSAISGCASS